MRVSKVQIDIYEFTDYAGGEDIWLKRISDKMGSRLIKFWNLESGSPALKPSGFLNHIIHYFCIVASRFNSDFSKGIYSLFGVYTYHIKRKDVMNLISSTFMPLPHGSNILTYIHTPSRLLTIYNEKELEARKGSPLRLLYYKLWRLSYIYMYRKSMNRCPLKLSNSSNTQNRLKYFLSVDSTVLFPSQDVESFINMASENYFFYPSRFTPPKRQMFVLRAFEIFCKNNNNFRLVLAGTIPDDVESKEYFRDVKNFIKTHNLPVELKLDNSRTEIINLYSKARACLFAGEDEDFGQVPIEAMASSKPILSVDEGGPKETILQGETGYLVSDEREMAEKMLILARDSELAEKIGGKGRLHVEKTFSDEVFISKLQNRIEETFKN